MNECQTCNGTGKEGRHSICRDCDEYNVETMSLAKQIIEHEKLGSSCRSSSLGFCRMPEGYALMLDADETFFYWLRHDGVQSDVSWDRWAIWRGACANLSNHEKA